MDRVSIFDLTGLPDFFGAGAVLVLLSLAAVMIFSRQLQGRNFMNFEALPGRRLLGSALVLFTFILFVPAFPTHSAARRMSRGPDQANEETLNRDRYSSDERPSAGQQESTEPVSGIAPRNAGDPSREPQPASSGSASRENSNPRDVDTSSLSALIDANADALLIAIEDPALGILVRRRLREEGVTIAPRSVDPLVFTPAVFRNLTLGESRVPSELDLGNGPLLLARVEDVGTREAESVTGRFVATIKITGSLIRQGVGVEPFEFTVLGTGSSAVAARQHALERAPSELLRLSPLGTLVSGG